MRQLVCLSRSILAGGCVGPTRGKGYSDQEADINVLELEASSQITTKSWHERHHRSEPPNERPSRRTTDEE